MSHRILRALMQLFAIIANADRLTERGRSIVESFLKQQLSRNLVNTYLEIFDTYFGVLQGKEQEGKLKKRVSVNSVKVLRICTEINAELNQKQKYIVMMHLIEFAYSSNEIVSGQELEFIATVANVFNIDDDEFKSCMLLASMPVENVQHPFLVISDEKNYPDTAKHLYNETLSGKLIFYLSKQVSLLFVRYAGNALLTLNGRPLFNNGIQVFAEGSVIRGSKAMPVYYSDVMRCFLEDENKMPFSLQAHKVTYVFNNGRTGLHNISFTATSGNLIGIMGSSGAGKSTLLNILNSNLFPTQGFVTINGINIHDDKNKLEGIIGFVPQDDLLIEDLSVYQNLFYNSKLCFGNLSDDEIDKKVNELLVALSIIEIKNLKVGSPLDKTISGGQRKRLNIALELIRRPAVLFVDEPTSGLSSLDSENVMDLLKQLAIYGKLVFVVIHQPSSAIFKLFDQLFILDTGGYPIYYGNPVDSLSYFKNKASFADDVSECETCGNINPEQVFSIIESRVNDEFGNATMERKFLPEDWNSIYNEAKTQANTNTISNPSLKSEFKKPNKWQQLIVYLKRDLLSKLYNTQYLLINYLQAPVLALILAYFLKYSKDNSGYIFQDNPNLPAFIFIGVIVALFMGLTVSAEEIIRDRKILKREAFLNLSRSSYLCAKVVVMFFISAVQTFSFTLIANFLFGIKDMFFDYWLMLFSVSCFANLLGLNISASFNSVVTIYIIIPFLIIPQIILSGVMVKFDYLNPTISSPTRVPIVGEIMVSRWAFEALAVNQFKNNAYEKNFYSYNKTMSNATFKNNVWQIKMRDMVDSLHANKYGNKANDVWLTVTNELKKEGINTLEGYQAQQVLQKTVYTQTTNALQQVRQKYQQLYKNASQQKDALVATFNADQLIALEQNYANTNLSNLVLDKDNFDPIVVKHNALVQRYHPVYTDGDPQSCIRSLFYVARKNLFGTYLNTYTANLMVIWIFTFTLSVTLYYNVLRKALSRIGKINFKKKNLTTY